MSVTVVTRRRARAGQEAALVATIAELFESTTRRAPSRRSASLFQGMDDPAAILYVAEWESLEARQGLRLDRARYQPVDALCEGEVERYFMHRLSLFEDMSRRATAVSCFLAYCPSASRDEFAIYLQETARPILRTAPDFVLRYLYQDLDEPARYLGLIGWSSPQALASPQFTAIVEQLDVSTNRLGVTVERFVGLPRAHVEPHAPPGTLRW